MAGCITIGIVICIAFCNAFCITHCITIGITWCVVSIFSSSPASFRRFLAATAFAQGFLFSFNIVAFDD